MTFIGDYAVLKAIRIGLRAISPVSACCEGDLVEDEGDWALISSSYWRLGALIAWHCCVIA